MKALTTQALIFQLSLLFQGEIDIAHIDDELDDQVKRMQHLLFTELDTGGHRFWLEREALQALIEPRLKACLAKQDFSVALFEGWLNQFMQWQLPRLALIVISFLSRFKSQGWASVYRGRVMQQLGDFEQAKEMYQQAIEQAPDDAHGYFHLGYLAMLAKQAVRAIALFDQCLTLDPHYIGANLNKGYCLHKIEQFDDAVYALHTEIKNNPSLTPAFLTLAKCLLECSEFQQAKAVCEQLLVNDPTNIHGLKLLATAAVNLQDPLLTCDAIERCIKLGDKDLDMQHIYVDALFQCEQWLVVLNYIDPLISSDPEDPQFIEYAFIANYQLQRWQEALQCFTALCQVSPSAKATYKHEFVHISAQLIPVSIIESV